MRFGWILAAVVGIACILLIVNHDQGSVLGMRDEQFARLVYLSVFGVLILAGILPAKGEFRSFVRNGIIWIAVIAVLMTGYVYRYELQDIGSRLTGGLIAGSPMSGQTADGRNQVSIFRSDNGHFWVNGLVNNQSVRFLVDTGASSIVLSSEDAKAAGIELSQLRFNVPVSTANGTTTAARARISSLEVGDIQRSNFPVMVAQSGNLEDSLLGMRFIDTLRGFEIRGDRMIFTD